MRQIELGDETFELLLGIRLVASRTCHEPNCDSRQVGLTYFGFFLRTSRRECIAWMLLP